jgi:uncharacterized protein (TIGR00369 family)
MTNTTASSQPYITVEAFRRLLAANHPFAAVLGAEVLDIGFGTAVLGMSDRSEHKRLGGIVAGPMLMGLADLALYAAVVGVSGNTEAVTASLTINFLRKAPAGDILAKARILKTGRLTAGEALLVPAGETGENAPIAQVISTWTLPRGHRKV